MKLMKQISILLLLSVVCILFCSCGIGKNGLAEIFDAWEEENDPNIAIYDDRKNLVIVNGQTISLQESLGKYYENIDQDLIVCVKDNKIYGLHAYNFVHIERGYNVDLYSFDIAKQEFEVLYTGIFGPGDSDRPRKQLSDETVYYNNNTIVFTEGYHLVSYKIDTGEVEELNPQDFSKPKKEYSIERVYDENGYIDFKAIIIKSETDERTISVDYMAERHPYVQDLLNIGVLRNPLEEVDPLKSFFNDSFVVNGKIYLVCDVMDNDGESNGVLFSYDYENDQFTFIHHVFSNAYPDLVIIPNES